MALSIIAHMVLLLTPTFIIFFAHRIESNFTHLPLNPWENKIYPGSEASREVANLNEIKNPHTPVNGVKEFVCLSVTNFDLNYLRTGKIDWA